MIFRTAPPTLSGAALLSPRNECACTETQGTIGVRPVGLAGGLVGSPAVVSPRWGEKWAQYESGGGMSDLIFGHQMMRPNLSTQGIAVLANTLDLNGGAIKSAAMQEDANLSHPGCLTTRPTKWTGGRVSLRGLGTILWRQL